MSDESKGPSFTIILEGLTVVVILYVVYKLLDKFNLFGKSEDTKNAEALGEDPTFSNVVTNITRDPKNIFLQAIHKKFGEKPTSAQLKSLLPNYPNYPKWVTTINFDVHHNFTQNDSTLILNIFKIISSQYEANFFATEFSLTTGHDMYAKLDKLMHDSDMSKLRTIISSKPII